LLTPSKKIRASNRYLNESLNLLVWENYDWWASLDSNQGPQSYLAVS